jgi:hypothetical protein
MALSGQLSDLSLAELIEFFCNQRKTGRLKIAYQHAPGYFYFDRGELVDAKIGALSGVDAVYYALTLENASFKFSTSFEATRRTIHRPWAHVALEGLRRLDEGVTPKEAFPDGVALAHEDEPDDKEEHVSPAKVPTKAAPAAAAPPQSVEANQAEESSPLSLMVESSNENGRSRTFVYAAIAAALVLSIAAIGFPAGWYGKRKSVASAPAAAAAAPEVKPESQPAGDSTQSDQASTQTENSTEPTGGASNIFAVRQQQEREREARERMLAAQDKAGAQAAVKPNAPPQALPTDVKKPEPSKPAPKTVTVQVTYDENGRVTQASGGDGMAQRIARQKRFPTGKAGSATVTIPVN